MDKVVRNYSKWFDYIFLLFLILWSGGGFTYGLISRWMFYFFPVLFLMSIYSRQRYSLKEVLTILLIYFVLILQMYKFGGSLTTTFTPILTIISCSIFAKLLGNRFPIVFVNIVYYISAIALICWIISLTPWGLSLFRSISSYLPQLGWNNFDTLTNEVDSLYIFSVPKTISGFIRNCGPFWEPGRFTIFITIAIGINLFYNKEYIFSNRNLLLIITNITTFSTTGYIAMCVLLIGYLFYARIKRIHKIIMVFLMLLIIPYVIQLDFIADKILEQSADVDTTWSRFGAMVYHWSQIVRSPYIGYGPFLINVEDELLLSPNGLTDLIRYYGVPLSLMIYVMLFKSTYNYIGHDSVGINVVVFVSIILLCFSQTITTSPFFYLLYFLSFSKNNLVCRQR